MLKFFVFLIFTIVLLQTKTYAEWSFLGDHNKLKGYIITHTGDVTPYKPRTFSNEPYDDIVYYFNTGNEISFCFKLISGNKLEIENEAALLLIDTNKNLKLAFFKTLVDKIDVFMMDFSNIDCT